MRIRLNRITAGLLLIILFPLVLPIRIYRWITGTGKRPAYLSTIEGDPLGYTGDRPLVVSLWASWATVWSVATEAIVRGLQAEFEGICEFAYVEVTGRDVEARYNVQVTPAVLVFHRGREVARFINLLEADELRRRIAGVAAEVQGAPASHGES